MTRRRPASNPREWGKSIVVLANGVPIQRVPVSLARRFAQICMAVAAEVAAEDDLSALQLGGLTYLRQQPGLGQNDLAARLGIDRSNNSLIVDQLEQRGLIERHTSASDRRAKLVYLTQLGTDICDRLRPKGGIAQARILKALKPNDRERFLDMLVAVIDANEAYVRPGAGRRKPGRRQAADRKQIRSRIAVQKRRE
jgi:DNA-binding MarR family transcriptional regulator